MCHRSMKTSQLKRRKLRLLSYFSLKSSAAINKACALFNFRLGDYGELLVCCLMTN